MYTVTVADLLASATDNGPVTATTEGSVGASLWLLQHSSILANGGAQVLYLDVVVELRILL
jgi:hypothetical protein